ncbi:hypothetical protein JXA48_02255 [Candidatus Woesearchaeota archaeon]|nr:hypothetical protein [Candidatus Woesearchaeota archaeon]
MADDWKKWKESSYSKKEVFEWPLTFKYRGEFDYDGLMNVIRSYYAKNKFDKLDEPKFKYKVGGGGKAEVEFTLFSEMKATGFTKVSLTIDGHMWNVERGKPTNGKVQLKIQSGFIHDYGKGFDENSKLQRFMLQKIYTPTGKGVAYADVKSEGKKNAEKVANGLLNEIKSFIGVECV